MTMKYGEPWVTRKEKSTRHDYWPYIDDCDGNLVRGDVSARNTARIVACVNALAGVPHPEKLPALLSVIKKMQVAETDEDIDAEIPKLFEEYRQLLMWPLPS